MTGWGEKGEGDSFDSSGRCPLDKESDAEFLKVLYGKIYGKETTNFIGGKGETH